MKELTSGWSLEPLPPDLVLSQAVQYRAQARALQTLLGTLKLAGLDDAAVTSVTNALEQGAAQAEANDLESKILVALVGGDVRFGRAYALGGRLRAMIGGAPAAGATLGAAGASDADLAKLVDGLDALSSDLPSHAARGVALSISAWSQSTDQGGKARLVRAQVDLWRSVLVGAKRGTEMLEPDNYIDAARELESRFLRRALRSPWLIVTALVALVLFAAGLYFLFAANGHASKLAAGASGVLAALGLTWKGIGGTVGKFVGKLEPPLWGAELDAAIADAVTLKVPAANGGGAAIQYSYADRSARALATPSTTQ